MKLKLTVDEKKAKFPRKHSILGIYDILPDDVDVDMDALAQQIDDYLMEKWRSYIETYRIEPVAFGLHKIVAKIDMPEDIVGGTEPVEMGIMDEVPGIQRAECGMVSRT
jgi:translation elongation factor aEF-1 beta